MFRILSDLIESIDKVLFILSEQPESDNLIFAILRLEDIRLVLTVLKSIYDHTNTSE